MNKSRKTINKETQEAIKKFLTSNISRHHVSVSKCSVFHNKSNKFDEIKSNALFFQESPTTPTIDLDPNFSRILQKKREEQLEASRQKLYNSTVSRFDSTIEQSHIEKKSESLGSVPIKRTPIIELENSMMFGKVNKSWNEVSEDEDSFLALERQCNMEDKHERLINANANDTLLFDIEPPSELWDETINQSLAIANLDKSHDSGDTNGISLDIRNHFAITRPSTIIEETSSQVDSSTKSSNSSASTNVMFNDTGSTVETVKELSIKSCDTTKESNSSSKSSIISPFGQQNTRVKQIDRQRRGTFAFKRANYTFFPDENLIPINESNTSETTTSVAPVEEVKTPVQKLINIDSNSAKHKNKTEDDEDQFNNTLERVDYLLERGKQFLEETPIAKRSMHHNSLLETPIFSCKRKRLLSEMASEMLPLPKRGPLIDFSTPEVTNQSRPSKFARK